MLARWRFERALRPLRESDHAILWDYAKAQWPARDSEAADAEYLAIDFELDGLQRNAHLLQAGWVPATAHSLPLSQARSADIRSSATLDDTAVAIHGIGEQRAQRGEPLREVMEAIIGALAGRILIGHAAWIDVQAIKLASRKLWGMQIPVRSVCTLALEKHLRPNLVGPEVYRLAVTRTRYGLPDYRAHDALTDAIAAAELFQAQMAHLPGDCPLARIEGA